MIARDWEGQLIQYKSLIRQWKPPPREAEAYGHVEALRWIHTMQVREVIVETGCQQVQQALTRNDRDDTEFGRIIEECRRLLDCQLITEVVWVRRECNMVADAIEKRAIHVDDSEYGTTSLD
ncbi:hypothetical protein LINPERPRIM_LOCUS32719 [Linum perenne]